MFLLTRLAGGVLALNIRTLSQHTALNIILPGVYHVCISLKFLLLLSFLGPAFQSLQHRAAGRQRRARAPGTLNNHRYGVLLNLAFCRRAGVDPYQAHYQDICAYVEYLTDHINAPSTIRNKISQVRVHLGLVEVSLVQINHPRVARALEALDRDKTYVPRVKSPLEPSQLYQIIANIKLDPLGHVARAAILTIYFGALRQTELLPRTVKTWNPLLQPTLEDLVVNHDSCTITIKAGKNMQRVGQSREVVMERSSNAIVCPVRAIQTALCYNGGYSANDPIFAFPGTAVPITAPKVTKMMHQVMTQVGLSHIISKVSLHSIRKSAATDAYLAGCSETSIRQYGGWTSTAYRSYISSSNRTVNRALLHTKASSNN